MTVDGNVILSRRETYDVSVDNGAYGKTTLSGALAAPPTLPVYDENGVPTQIETAYTFGSVDMRNPAIFLEPRKSRRLMDKILANSSVLKSLTDWFSKRWLVSNISMVSTIILLR
jgi:hypothetical protein